MMHRKRENKMYAFRESFKKEVILAANAESRCQWIFEFLAGLQLENKLIMVLTEINRDFTSNVISNEHDHYRMSLKLPVTMTNVLWDWTDYANNLVSVVSISMQSSTGFEI